MKNLKRILSLALASTMLIGMMVVGASAADFGDAEDIKNTTAVETLVALGIIKGYGGESNLFGPQDTLTRAQMATMIATAMNGGVQWTFKPTSYKHQDVSTHWAAASIAYCSDLKIVNGYSDTIFGPEDNLTSTMAARMLLNAMGYTEYTGSWDLATEVQAQELGLYNGLDREIAGQDISRDDVAQMFYNALTAPMAGDRTYTTTAPKDVVTGLETKWQIALTVKADGTYDAPASVDTTDPAKLALWLALEAETFPTRADAVKFASTKFSDAKLGIHYDLMDVLVPTTEEQLVPQTHEETLAHKYLSLVTPEITLTKVKVNASGKYVLNGISSYTVAEDPSALMGHRITVLQRTTDGKVYGITDAAYSVVYDGTVGDYAVPSGLVSSNDTIRGTTIYQYNNSTGNNLVSYGTIAANDANNDGKLDTTRLSKEWKLLIVRNVDEDGRTYFTALVTPEELGQVANVTATRYTLTEPSTVLGGAASKLIGYEITAYEGIAPGDFVTVIPGASTVSGLAELTKVTDTVTGTVTAVRENDNRIQVDGTWYNKATRSLDHGTVGFVNAVDRNLLGKEVTLVNVNGYFAYAESETTLSKDLVILTKVAAQVNKNTLHDSVEVSAIFLADGTTATIRVDKLNVTGSSATGATVAYDDDENLARPDVNTLYRYSVSADGFYTLTKATAGNTGYPDTVNNGSTLNNNKINSYLIADDATVVVNYGGATPTKYKVVDGKTVKGWKYTTQFTTPATGVVGFADTVRNVPYIQVLVLTTTMTDLPGAKGIANYGYITSDPYLYADTANTAKSRALVYTLWNGTEEITVYDSNYTANLQIGDMIKYQDKGNGNITSDSSWSTTDYAVKGYARGDEVLYLVENGTTANPYVISEDVTIFYINSYDYEGADSGIISNAEAIQNDDGDILGYWKNVKVVLGPVPEHGTHLDREIIFLVIDVYNDLDNPTIPRALIP